MGVDQLGCLAALLEFKIGALRLCEGQVASAFPSLAEICFSPALQAKIRERAAIAWHRFRALGNSARDLNATAESALTALLEEGKGLIASQAEADPSVLDAAVGSLIDAVCHSMMANYGSASSYAGLLHAKGTALLYQFFNEEARLHCELRRLINSEINPAAAKAVPEISAAEDRI